MVEHCDSAAVSARHVLGNDTVSGRPTGVDAARKLSFFKYAQVHTGLGHYYQYRLHSAIPSVTDIVCSKPYRITPHVEPHYSYNPPTNVRLFVVLLCCLNRSRRTLPLPIPGTVPPTLAVPFYSCSCSCIRSTPHLPTSFTSAWGTP